MFSHAVHMNVDAWCRTLHANGLERPWDLIFPPEVLYGSGSSFEVGNNTCHGVVMKDGKTIAMYVLAMRDSECCLVDVRCIANAPADWVEIMADDWQEQANKLNATAMTGPLGAFALLPDGVSEPGTMQPSSLHIPQFPQILVACLQRRGYVHVRSGTIWGRQGASGSANLDSNQSASSVRVGTWMNVISIARELEKVLSASFSTLPTHRGSGAALVSLIRAYAPIFLPRLVLLGVSTSGSTAGAVFMHKDVAHVSPSIYRLPRFAQLVWLRLASLRSRDVHTSLIGVVPSARNSRISFDLYHAASRLFQGAEHVTTSWICDKNEASKAMSKRIGLQPLQQRFVFQLVCQSCSTSKER